MSLEIVEMLASVFGFKKCFLILAVDKEILIKAAKLKLSKRELDTDEVYCKQYLNRFVNISIDTPDTSYNIKPFLREYFINISLFSYEELVEKIHNSEELKKGSGFQKADKTVLDLLSDVVLNSIGKNPRYVKQVINNLSLLDSLRRHSWYSNEKDKYTPWQVETITKEMLFIIKCIYFDYPKVVGALALRPYFKMWDIEFAVKYFTVGDCRFDVNMGHKYNITNTWELVLLYICKCSGYESSFSRLKQVFGVIDVLFEKYISERNLDKSEDVYKDIISDIFVRFYRVKFSEGEHGILSRFFVNTRNN